MKRQEIVDAARSYLGVPWHHIGRTRAGLDCVGLIVMVATDLGVPYEDQRAYTRGPQVQNFLSSIRSQTAPALDFKFRRPGQIAIFRQQVYPMHIGIVGLDIHKMPTIIHAAAKARMVVEESLYGVLEEELIELREIPGVED